MVNLCRYLKTGVLQVRACSFTVLLCCAALHGAQAQDDLYFSPKRQKEIDRQNAVLKAYHDSIRAAQRPATSEYTATWSNFDSVDHRGYRGIYEIAQNYDNSEDIERESYADRLRYDDPTYVVYARDPYYDSWWGYGGYYGYPSWGLNVNQWGWSIGWSYPYYSYGWGYPYYGWNNPYYGWGWSYPYYGSYPYYPHYSTTRYATNYHRGSSMSGTGSNSGYTDRSNVRPSQRSSALTVPSSAYTVRTQGSYTRPSQGAAGNSSSGTTYSESGRSYQSVQQERARQNSGSSFWGNQQNASSQSYNSGSTSSSSSSSNYSRSSGSSTRSSGGSSSGGGRRGGSGR